MGRHRSAVQGPVLSVSGKQAEGRRRWAVTMVLPEPRGSLLYVTRAQSTLVVLKGHGGRTTTVVSRKLPVDGLLRCFHREEESSQIRQRNA